MKNALLSLCWPLCAGALVWALARPAHAPVPTPTPSGGGPTQEQLDALSKKYGLETPVPIHSQPPQYDVGWSY